MTLLLLFLLLLITRLSGLNWGSPYFFHPDENNLATSLMQLSCPQLSLQSLNRCFDPQFYAYGHIYIYLVRLMLGVIKTPNLALRLISSLSSIGTGIVFYKLIRRDFHSQLIALFALGLYIFTPIFIQFSHFGTTESLLIFLMLLVLYFQSKPNYQAFLIGMSAAVKISSFSLLIIPFLIQRHRFAQLIRTMVLALIVFVILTPHYWLNLNKAYPALIYEASVANGQLSVFYTQQFRGTVPLLFQFSSIFPFALGIGVLLMTPLGVWYLYQKKRIAFLISFSFLLIYQSVLFAKWVRFQAFSYPFFIYLVSAAVAYLQEHRRNLSYLVIFLMLVYQIMVGIPYLEVYRRADTRVKASHWINQNVPAGAYLLSEAANVLDIPFKHDRFAYQSYFLYEIDRNPGLAKQVFASLNRADYVVVPSRRVFRNYTCYLFKNHKLVSRNCDQKTSYPLINQYYRVLFESEQFRLIKTFSANIDDENAEETISVFDHPTIRVYQRVKPTDSIGK